MSKCDIIVPVWNQLELTRECLESVERNTVYPHRLVVVDNASDQETSRYLEELGKRLNDKVLLLKNEKNEGFVKAVNRGIAASDSEYVCILNNDTIVTRGWLDEIVKLFDVDSRIGIVNPSSNSLGQKMPKGTGIEEYAEKMKSQSGLFVDIGCAFGFCMLMKRNLFGKIGYFDETYGTGNYDDTDISLRAKREGYRTVRAFASYVYHREKASFIMLKDFGNEFEKNKRMFESRWGKTERVIAVFRNVDRDSLERLRNILKEHAKEKSWVYVISPFFETREFFEQFSNLTFHHYNRAFYLMAFLRIVFKKKKPDVIYGDSGRFLNVVSMLKIHPKAKIKKIYG